MSRDVVIGVLALQGDVREHLAALAECDVLARPVRRAEELASVDGLIIPGGESTTMGKLLGIFELLEPLRERIKAGMPVYGSCAGMILLADKVVDGRDDQVTVGGIDMVVRRNAFGRQVDSFETDVNIVGLEHPFHAVFIRAPRPESVGAGVEVLAHVEADGAEGTIVAVRQGRLLATAFHPELTSDLRVHSLFAEMVHDAVRERTARTEDGDR